METKRAGARLVTSAKFKGVEDSDDELLVGPSINSGESNAIVSSAEGIKLAPHDAMNHVAVWANNIRSISAYIQSSLQLPNFCTFAIGGQDAGADTPAYINQRGLTCSIICFSLYGMTYALPSLLPLMIAGYDTSDNSTMPIHNSMSGYDDLNSWGPGPYDGSSLESTTFASHTATTKNLYGSIYLYSNVLQNVSSYSLILC